MDRWIDRNLAGGLGDVNGAEGLGYHFWQSQVLKGRQRGVGGEAERGPRGFETCCLLAACLLLACSSSPVVRRGSDR